MTDNRRSKLRPILRIAAIVANSLMATLLLMSAYGGIVNPL